MADHVFTEGEKKCLEAYWRECSKTPRKNLIKLVRHINMFNPLPSEKSWEYIFFDRQLTDAQVDFALKMKLRKSYYIDELAAREGMSIEDTAKMADDLVHIGLLEYHCDERGVDRVQLPVFAPGCMESTVMTKERTDAFPETAPAFLNYVLELQKLISWAVPMGQALSCAAWSARARRIWNLTAASISASTPRAASARARRGASRGRRPRRSSSRPSAGALCISSRTSTARTSPSLSATASGTPAWR